MKKPYNNFDLPRQHLTSDHYVPSRARHADEIDRRRTLPRGTLLAEQQRDGLHIASNIASNVQSPQDLAFVTDTLAVSGLNAGWYNYAQKSDVMRRRLLLPELANDDEDWRESRSGLLTKAQEGLVHAAEMATVFAAAKTERKDTQRQTFLLGRHLGNVALELACVPLGNAPRFLSAFEVQSVAREKALETLERSRIIADQVGTNPSIAQLSDPDSPLSVYWRRNAPNGAYEAYEQAIEEFPHAA